MCIFSWCTRLPRARCELRSPRLSLEAIDAPKPAPLPPSSPVPDASDPYGALRIRDFRLFLIGNVIATVGTQMQTVAIGWELYERTSSALALGGVGLAQFLPIALLTIPAGHVADRIDRRRLLMAAELLMVACGLGLALVSFTGASVVWVYALLLLTGTARAFLSPAKDSLGPQLVPRELFANAATWRSSGFQLASVVGPALGGLLIGWLGRATMVYVVNAATALTYFVLLLPVRPRAFVRSTRGATLHSILEGLRFVRDEKLLLATITLDLFAVLLGGAETLLPIFARDILHVGPRGLGWLLSAPPIGAFVMAFVLAHHGPLRRAGRALLLAVAGFGAATVAFGLSRSFALSLLMLALLGAFDNVSVVIRSTLVQVLTPDAMRGRIAAVNSLFVGTSNELGGFESGVVAAAIGPVGSVVLGGLGTLVVVIAIGATWPEIRRLGELR